MTDSLEKLRETQAEKEEAKRVVAQQEEQDRRALAQLAAKGDFAPKDAQSLPEPPPGPTPETSPERPTDMSPDTLPYAPEPAPDPRR